VGQASDRREQARLAADRRAEGKTWVEIAETLAARWALKPRAALRIAHGWSQGRAAEEWNRRWPDDLKTFKNFSYWETWPDSGYAPSLLVLRKLARLYECRVADLVADLGDFRHLDDPRMTSHHHDDPWPAIERTLEAVVSAGAVDARPDGGERGAHQFERRVRRAWDRGDRESFMPMLTLIAGFAGSGKTEFGEFLSRVSGWAHLDKDTLTRPLAEGVLRALGGNPNDRESPMYLAKVRPLEYRCLVSAAFANLQAGISTVITSPFLAEVGDHQWLQRLNNNATRLGVQVSVVWVNADAESMHEYLNTRGAARDSWKLLNWDQYLASIDLEMRPVCNHLVVDNRCNAAVGLADRARELVERGRR
jgi:predicted kinase